MSTAIPPIHDHPAASLQPSRGDFLSLDPEILSIGQHTTIVRCASGAERSVPALIGAKSSEQLIK